MPSDDKVVEPEGPMVKRGLLVEEATTKGVKPAVACTFKVTEAEVALMPTTEPSSMSLPAVKVEALVQIAL